MIPRIARIRVLAYTITIISGDAKVSLFRLKKSCVSDHLHEMRHHHSNGFQVTLSSVPGISSHLPFQRLPVLQVGSSRVRIQRNRVHRWLETGPLCLRRDEVDGAPYGRRWGLLKRRFAHIKISSTFRDRAQQEWLSLIRRGQCIRLPCDLLLKSSISSVKKWKK